MDLVLSSGGGTFTFLNDGTGRFGPAAGPLAAGFGTVRVVDLDADGKADIVAADVNGQAVRVTRGRGDGTFRPPVVLPAGDFVQSIDVADLNGDGRPDVVASLATGVAVRLNTGTAELLGDAAAYPADPAPDGIGVAAADFTGDGRPDVVLAGRAGGRVYLYPNAGNGTLGTPVAYPLGAGQQPWDVAVADFDRDGKVDAAVTVPGNGAVAVFLGNGDGTLRQVEGFTTPSPSGLAAADFDADGIPDLAASSYWTSQVFVYPGDGTGEFGPGVAAGAAGDPSDVTAADVTGDGRPDLLSTATTSPAAVVVTPNTSAPAPAATFAVTAAAAVAGDEFDLTVTARTAAGATAAGYVGTVRFTSTDGRVAAGDGLPTDLTFTPADNGRRTVRVTFRTAGPQSVTVTDTVAAALTGQSTVTVAPAAPAAVAVVSGGGQTAAVGTPFTAPAVRVTDRFGNPVPGAVVTFIPPAAGASAVFPGGGTATAGADGRAAVAVRAGTTAGTYPVGVAAGTGTASFELTNTPGAPAAVTVVGGDGQSAVAGATFPVPLTVRVTDPFGNPVPGAAVVFSGPTAGPGAVFRSPAATVAAADGLAGVTAAAGPGSGRMPSSPPPPAGRPPPSG